MKRDMKIKKRRITPAMKAAHKLTDEEVTYWDSLSVTDQEDHYTTAVADLRATVLQENTGGQIGLRGVYGKGAALAQAVSHALSFSPDELKRCRDEDAQRREDRANELHICIECGKPAPERYSLVMMGGPAACFPCAREYNMPMAPAETEAERLTLAGIRSEATG